MKEKELLIDQLSVVENVKSPGLNPCPAIQGQHFDFVTRKSPLTFSSLTITMQKDHRERLAILD